MGTLALPALAALALWLSSPGATPSQAAAPRGPLPDLEAALPVAPLAILQPTAVERAETEAVPAPAGRLVKVRPGDSLIKLLREAGVAPHEAQQALATLTEVFDPRELQPGQAIRIALAAERDSPPTGDPAQPLHLVSLALQPDASRDIRVLRNDSVENFIASTIERPLSGEIQINRQVSGSPLLIAGQRAGVPTPDMIDLVRAFSYEVDFQREIHEAEDFELLYETRYEARDNLAGGGVLYAALSLNGQRMELYRFARDGKEPEYFDANGVSVRRALLRTPVDGARLSSGFGMRKHPILGYSKMHRGVDFAAPSGTPVFAAGDGLVVAAERDGAYGNHIRLRHGDATETAYAHLSRYALGIVPGRQVTQGQIIGYVGSSGRSTGPHLHYEVLLGGERVDPASLKLPNGDQLMGADLDAFRLAKARIDRLRKTSPNALQLVQAGCASNEDAGFVQQLFLSDADGC